VQHRDDERDVAGEYRGRVTYYKSFAFNNFCQVKMPPSLEDYLLLPG